MLELLDESASFFALLSEHFDLLAEDMDFTPRNLSFKYLFGEFHFFGFGLAELTL